MSWLIPGTATVGQTGHTSDHNEITSALDIIVDNLTVNTAVKTANYTALAGDMVVVSTTTNPVTITLPAAPVNGSQVGVLLASGTNAITINAGIGDIIAVTIPTLTLVGQSILLQYSSLGTSWYPVNQGASITTLDSRYDATGAATAAAAASVPLSSFTTKGDLLAGTGSGTLSRLGVGSNTQMLTADSTQATGLKWTTPFINPMTTAGDMITGGASGTPSRVPGGTANYVLTSNGATSAPTWQATPRIKPSGDTTGATDTAAIQAALTAGSCELIHSGTYYTNAPLTMPSNCYFNGHGSTISPGSGWTGTTGMLTLASGAVQNTITMNVIFTDSYAKASLSGVYLISANSVPNNYLYHVTCRNFLGNGFVLNATADSASAHLVSCVAYGNMGDGFQLSSDQVVTNCEAGFNGGHGYHLLSGASNVYISNCLAWYSGVNPQTSIWPGSGTSCGFFLDLNSQFVTITNCSAQQNGLHGFAMGATSGSSGFTYACTINGCSADTNSSYANNAGHGIFVSGCFNAAITSNVGGNNNGLSPGVQKYGIQVTGDCSYTAITGNSIAGSDTTPVNFVSGAYGFSWDAASVGTMVNNATVGTQTVSAVVGAPVDISNIYLYVSPNVPYRVKIYIPYTSTFSAGTPTVIFNAPTVTTMSLNWRYQTAATPFTTQPTITTGTTFPTMTGPTLSTAAGLALIVEGSVMFSAEGRCKLQAYTSNATDTFTIGRGCYMELLPTGGPTDP